ncbi:MAG TPA: NUDIX domain-containing protein [Candidatus Saccharimonadales bacterium]|jgi:8-oxo-dGTP pyrophosphatase MutT (NUDIX family)
MRQRAGALYVQDHRLFLICEGQQGSYWTPGGGLEKDETFEQALERELQEELDATLLSADLYIRMKDKAANEEICYFLVNMSIPKVLPNGTTYYWYGRDDHEANTVQISQRVYKTVFPKLIADELV